MTVPLPSPEAILFDWDNTLVDNWPVIAAALNAALTAMGQAAWTEAEVRARVRRSARETFPEMFGDRAEEAERIFYAAFAAGHLAGLAPMAGAVAALDAAAARGIYLAVVSNKHGGFLRAEADHLGWTGRFGRIVGATDTAADKPAPEPVLAALEGTGIAPGLSVWFVGDAGIDMECAARTGCVPVLVRDETTLGAEFDRWPPRLHLPHCLALASLF
ncbi:MAG: HAD family hydrolase [Alphaproteobacteria bacterium]|nr:HAD family hydrolase [Alphaproteobacteria bacterium]